MGWEARERARFEYDDAGRLVGSVVTKEPEWDEQQRELMIAYEMYESSLGASGYPIQDEHDPEIGWDVEVHTNRYEAALSRARAEAKEKHPNDPQHGVVFVARKRE